MAKTLAMKDFMDFVHQANWHFTLSRSSLKPLIERLGGAYKKSLGTDTRTLDDDDLLAIQGLVWPLGVGATTDSWCVKKRKYRNALGYLVRELFELEAGDALLVGSYKANWRRYTLQENRKFITSSGATPADLHHSGGLSARFASELCIADHKGTAQLVGNWKQQYGFGNKFVFAAPMRTKADGSLKSAGAIKTQGFGANVYCFERKSGTQYMCMYKLEDHAEYFGEIAFPDDIPLAFIKHYPNGAENPNPPWGADQWTAEED